MFRNQRKKYFVDRQVQGALVRRAVVYVFLVLMLMSLFGAVCVMVMEGPLSGSQLTQKMWSKLGPTWVASILLVPIVVIDCIRLSNRFAGPIFRLRRAMKDVAAGKDVSPVKLRKGDFWYDFAEDFNRMLLERKAAELVAETRQLKNEGAMREPAVPEPVVSAT